MQTDRALLLGLIGTLLGLTVLIVRPYIQFIIGAVLLAFILYPLHDRLEPHLGPTVSALSLVVFSVAAVVVPIVVVLATIAGDALDWANRLQEAEVDMTGIEERVIAYTGWEVDLGEQLGAGIENAVAIGVGGTVSAVESVVQLLIGLGLLLFLLFFFVRDGHRLASWVRTVSPLPESVSEEVTQRTRDIVKAVLGGHVLIALVQGLVAGLGLFLTGVPGATFWTFVMILLALIPLIGTFLVWAPASAYLYLTGDVAAGAGLFAYGVLVVSVSDEYLRPIVVDRFAEISPSAIIVGVIGGLSVFGFIGLFVGPIIVGTLKECVEIYHRHYGQP